MKPLHPHPVARTGAVFLLLAAALAVLAVAAVPADAQFRPAPLRATGAITVTWQGSPARGCASGAPCDVVGNALLPLAFRGEIIAFSRDQFFADFFHQRSPVVRVRRRGSDPAGPVCVDAGGRADFGGPVLTVEPAQSGRVTIAFQPRFDAGRCAGPLAADVRPALPRVTVDADSLRRGARTISLRGSRRFAAGPFTGTVASTVVLRVGTPRVGRSFGVSQPRRARRRGVRRTERLDALRLTYDVTARGTLTASFRGLASPECELLDACGLSGSVVSARAAGGSVVASGGSAPRA